MYRLNQKVNYTATNGIILNAKILQSTSIISLNANYTISFTISNPVDTNGKISIKIPNQLIIQNYMNSPCSGLIFGLNSLAMCQLSNNTLTITKGFPIISYTNISYLIGNIANFNSVQTTDSFEIFTLDQNNYIIDQINSGLSVNFIEGSLIAPNVYLTNYTVLQNSNYTISFTLKNGLPFNSKIKISIPPEISIQNQSVSSQNCIYNDSSSIMYGICSLIYNTLTISNFNQNNMIYANTSIKIMIPFLTNPRSLKNTSNFSITTINPSGYNIDKGYLTVSMNTMANIISTNITSQSYTNGNITNYNIIIYPKTYLISGDQLIVKLPNQMSYLQNTNTIGIINLSNSLISNIIDNVTISISLNFTKGFLFNYSFVITIQNIRNPPSLKQTDNFGILIQDSSGYGLETLASPLYLQMTSPGYLFNCTVKPINQKNNNIYDYLVQISSINNIPVGGYIVIQYPNNLKLSTNSTILAQQGLLNNLPNFNNNSTSQQIFVKNLTQLSNYIQLIISSMIVSSNTTDSFQIFTYTNDGFLIDSRTSGLSIIYLCQPPCQTCQGDLVNCLTCSNKSSFPYLNGTNCLSTCPNGYFLNSNNECQQCSYTCQNCTDFGYCITCSNQFPLMIMNQRSCVQSCPEGYYVNNNNCFKCQLPCITCESQLECLSCDTNNPLNLLYTQQKRCVSTCPIQTFQNKSICISCSNSCKICNNTIDCLTCNDGFFGYGNSCVGTCPPGFYVKNQTCQTCINSHCVNCLNETICLNCKENYTLNNGTCQINLNNNNNSNIQITCDSGYFLNKFNNSCEQCSENCFKCENTSKCIACSPNNVFKENLCVSKCGDGFYKFNQSCTRCSGNCKTCLNENYCLSCIDNFVLSGNLCYENCQFPGLFLKNRICIKCGNNCSSCSGINSCIKCNNGFAKLKGFCYLDCPFGYIKDPINNCKINLDILNSKVYNYPKTYFLFLTFSVLSIFIVMIAKLKFDITFFIGSSLSIVSFFYFFCFLYFYYSSYLYGNYKYFILISFFLILMNILNSYLAIKLRFNFMYEHEFSDWISQNKFSYNIIFLLAFLVDFKIMRFIYSRFADYNNFNAKFKDYNSINKTLLRLINFDIVFINIPLIMITFYIIIALPAGNYLWYSSIEINVLSIIILLLKICEQILNPDLNQDQYYQITKVRDCLPDNVKNTRIDLIEKSKMNYKQTKKLFKRNNSVSYNLTNLKLKTSFYYEIFDNIPSNNANLVSLNSINFQNKGNTHDNVFNVNNIVNHDDGKHIDSSFTFRKNLRKNSDQIERARLVFKSLEFITFSNMFVDSKNNSFELAKNADEKEIIKNHIIKSSLLGSKQIDNYSNFINNKNENNVFEEESKNKVSLPNKNTIIDIIKNSFKKTFSDDKEPHQYININNSEFSYAINNKNNIENILDENSRNINLPDDSGRNLVNIHVGMEKTMSPYFKNALIDEKLKR